jgi:hypothetical protein
MPKDLPYFKFTVADWLTGDIVFESFNVQGLFINICAVYWQRDGVLSLEDIKKRFKNPTELSELTDRFFSVSNGFISIKFLDEQLEERKRLKITNSLNGKKGGRPKTLDAIEEKTDRFFSLTEHKANESNIEKKREEKRREELNTNCAEISRDDKDKILDKKIQNIKNSERWLEGFAMKYRSTTDYLRESLNDFVLVNYGKLDKPEDDIRHHFVSWLKYNEPKKRPETLEERAARLTLENIGK